MTISVCVGSSCHLKGAYKVIKEFQRLIAEKNLSDKVELKASFCLGNCTNGVSIVIDGGPVLSVAPENASEFFKEHVSGRI
ncbi:MAG TPA: hypothetical protein DD429_12200 [Clostridiaceae bacterium]|nr:hypothetical protein [Clostridiaceae bacterium]